MDWLKKRLSEPSSHAGLAGLLAAASWLFPQYAAAFTALQGLAGALGVLLPEAGNKK